jgi:hypothetical protein
MVYATTSHKMSYRDELTLKNSSLLTLTTYNQNHFTFISIFILTITFYILVII